MTDQYIALQLYSTGSRYEQNVLQLLRDSKLSDICYAYKIRTKPENKLLKKVEIKKQERDAYCLTDITDVVGIRLVALFKSDMVDLLDGVLSAINHSNGVNPNPFIRDQIEEIKVYKGALAFDDLSPRILDTVKKYFPNITVNEANSKEGYSSIHIVSRLNLPVEKIPNYYIPIEIQIRTVFEDAWGEIDHKYGYVIRTGKDSGKPINNPDSVLSHLKVLKKFTDACMEYADCIRNEAIGFPTQLVNPRKVISVISDEYILVRFKELNIPEPFIEKYKIARDKKEHSASSGNNDTSLYLEAAGIFKELADNFNFDKDERDPGESLAYYYSRMNEAFCLMATNDKDHVSAARSIYHNLDDHYAEYSLVKMRYGQALSKLGFIDDAILQLQASGELLNKISPSYVGQPENCWPDQLPLADYMHIAKGQPKLLGYLIWLKIKSLGIGNEEIKFNLFFDAYNLTLSALQHVDQNSPEELSIHNNLLYFSIGCLFRTKISGIKLPVKTEVIQNFVNEHIQYIEFHSKSPNTLGVSASDTLMKAYWLLNRKEEAKKYAGYVMHCCLQENFSELNDAEKVSLMRTANNVLLNQDIGVIN